MKVLKIITILIFLIPNILFGQLKQINISTNSEEQHNLTQFSNSIDSFRFRFSTENQAVEIWTNDFSHFFGKFLNFTKTIKSDPELFYSQVSEIDSITARQVYSMFIRYNVFQIPDQDSISGWKSGLDGATFTIQYSSPRANSYKVYWSPDVYKKINEAVILDTVYVQLYHNLNFYTRWWKFIDLLPFGCYDSAGWEITCTHKPKKKKRNK